MFVFSQFFFLCISPRYLLIYGDRKKKVEVLVNKDIESAQLQILCDRARELFNLSDVILQIWDKGFEDWVDLEDGDEIPTNSRIKVEVDKSAGFSTKSPPMVPSKPTEERRPQVVPHTQQTLSSVIGVASYRTSALQQMQPSATMSPISSAMLAPIQTMSSHLLTQAPSVLISPHNLRDSSQGHR